MCERVSEHVRKSKKITNIVVSFDRQRNVSSKYSIYVLNMAGCVWCSKNVSERVCACVSYEKKNTNQLKLLLIAI